MIPKATAADLELDFDRDWQDALAFGDAERDMAYIRRANYERQRADAAETHCRNHHLEPCETCIANQSEKIAAERERDIAKEALLNMHREMIVVEAERDEYIRQCKEALYMKQMAEDKSQDHFVKKVNAEAERDKLQKLLERAIQFVPFDYMINGECLRETLNAALAKGVG